MTIYSQHPSRGKVQILATYLGPTGITSSTVTSVDSPELATPVAEALNRIAACAAMPLCSYDERDDEITFYPIDHLLALVDAGARASLRQGAHSLWYEHVKVLLHQALQDLDDATAGLPAPVRMAISTELHTEERELRAAWTEYTTNQPHAEPQRLWDFHHPVILLGPSMRDLTSDVRGELDEEEEGTTQGRMRAAVEDLRLLADIGHRRRNDDVRFDVELFSVTHDPDLGDGYFLEIAAPLPSQPDNVWTVVVHRWVPDSWDENGEVDGATSEPVLEGELTTRPTIKTIAAPLHLIRAEPERLSAWAKTRPGEKFTGTDFVVNDTRDRAATITPG